MSEGNTPASWIGERVRVCLDPAEEVEGILEGVTEHGFTVNVSTVMGHHRHQRGPRYYSWKNVSWMYPVDQQTSGS